MRQRLNLLTGKANSVADAINAAEAGRALAVAGDVLDANYIKELVKRTAEFGGGKIHIIVNNAGFTWDGVIHKVSTLTHKLFLGFRPAGPEARHTRCSGHERLTRTISRTSVD